MRAPARPVPAGWHVEVHAGGGMRRRSKQKPVSGALFEAWESRQPVRGIAHASAFGFEDNAVAVLVPRFAWWLDIGL